MREIARLNTAEKLLLLSYMEDKARISYRASGTIRYIFAAVSILDLCMAGKLETEGRKIVVKDMSPLGDPVLDDILRRISERYDPRSCTIWLNSLAGGLQKKVMDGLLDKGIFWEDYESMLLIFTRKCYRLMDGRAGKQLHERIREVLLSEKEKFSPEDIILVAMLKNSNLLPLHMDRQELGRSRERIKSFLKEENLLEKVMGRELMEAYKAVNKALTEVKAAT